MAVVEIYSSLSCPYCSRAKDLLRRKGVKIKEFLIDGKPEIIAKAIERSGGRRTVPQIFIENFHVGGYDDLIKLDHEGTLDSMLGLIGLA